MFQIDLYDSLLQKLPDKRYTYTPVTTPLVRNEDRELVLPAISKLAAMITHDTNYLKLNLSIHRKALIDMMLKAGFELTEESLYMKINFDEKNIEQGET